MNYIPPASHRPLHKVVVENGTLLKHLEFGIIDGYLHFKLSSFDTTDPEHVRKTGFVSFDLPPAAFGILEMVINPKIGALMKLRESVAGLMDKAKGVFDLGDDQDLYDGKRTWDWLLDHGWLEGFEESNPNPPTENAS